MGFSIEEVGKSAKSASYELAKMSTESKNKALESVAKALKDKYEEILLANENDVRNAVARGTSPAMVDRLSLTKARIEAMADGLTEVIALEDPIGEVLEEFERPNGLKLKKIRVPMGVIGIIYESRPNVTADAFGLCFKSGNACVLRGGSDAISSNMAIVKVIREALLSAGVNPDVISLVSDTSREIASQMMKLNRYIDLLIPRGGAGLIRTVINEATIPVIETGTGNCHVYVDEDADIDMAVAIIDNAKTQRMGVCNACESLVVNEKIAEVAVPAICEKLHAKNIEIRAGQKVFSLCPKLTDGLVEATEEDYGTEYLGPVISLQIVADVDEAISHINKYTTHHSEAIITNNTRNAEKFLNEVDAACVYVNASTRFTDGFEFGFGAEIGISTQKLHARGPMGLKELTSYKYNIIGNGQVRG